MSEPEFKDGDLVEKFGGRYGGPGRIVGNTIALDDSGYRLWNVAMRVSGGYGEFVHVFPSGVLRPRKTWPEQPILDRIELAIASACDDNFTTAGTASRARHVERVETLSAAYDEIVALRRQCDGLVAAAVANGEGLLRFEGLIRETATRLSQALPSEKSGDA